MKPWIFTSLLLLSLGCGSGEPADGGSKPSKPDVGSEAGEPGETGGTTDGGTQPREEGEPDGGTEVEPSCGQCDGERPFCDPTSNRCVQCVTSADCSAFGRCTEVKSCECGAGYSGDGQSCEPIPQRLTALGLTGGTLSPAFSPERFSYTATLTAASTTVTAVAIPGSTVSINGKPSPATVVLGASTVIEVVVSHGPLSQRYTVTVSSPRLTSLEVTDGTLSPSFEAHRFDYTARVASLRTWVEAVAAPGYTVSIDGAPSPKAYQTLPGAPVSIVVSNGTVSQTYSLRLVSDMRYVKASNTGAKDGFGSAVAISRDGNTLVVGAPFEDSSGRGVGAASSDNAAPDSGAVYVYRKAGTTWSLSAAFKASNADPGDRFGSSVAVSQTGTVVIVGAPGEDSTSAGGPTSNTAIDSGAVYVFQFYDGAWSEARIIKFGNAGTGLGASVAVTPSGQWLVAGAPFRGGTDDLAGFTAVFSVAGAYYSDGQGNRAGGRLGTSVAISDDGRTWAGGAPKNLGGGMVDVRGPSAAGRLGSSTCANSGVACEFGASISMSPDGKVIAVGAPGAANKTGEAYLYALEGVYWNSKFTLTPSAASAQARFGASIALTADGYELFVGAPGDQGQGRIHHFTRGAVGWTPAAVLAPPTLESADSFGASAACGPSSACVFGAPGEDGASTGIDGDASSNGAVEAGAAWSFDF